MFFQRLLKYFSPTFRFIKTAGTIKITEQEKIQLRANAKTEVERLENVLGNTQTVQLLDAFKNKFNICETAYKVILAEHQRRKGNRLPSTRSPKFRTWR